MKLLWGFCLLNYYCILDIRGPLFLHFAKAAQLEKYSARENFGFYSIHAYLQQLSLSC